jgi:MerR family transcriptional regulator, light-induced transcriptional regulator
MRTERRDAHELRIGELSRRVGVSDHLLRAWESRYGLLRPVRSAGGFRLYSRADEDRVRHMQAHLARGLSAAEAARATLAEDDVPATPPDAGGAEVPAGPEDPGGRAGSPVTAGMAETGEDLRVALDAMDEPAAQAVLDRLLSDYTVEGVLREVLLPYLFGLGERWERGEVSVAQEHFASNLVRGRLTALARGWGNGRGPQALLACPPREQHDLALVVFGVVLSRAGWRVRYLGTDTPSEELVRLVATDHPDLVVLAATAPERFGEVRDDLARMAAVVPVAIAGAGATAAVARDVGARLLTGDPVSAAQRLASSPR